MELNTTSSVNFILLVVFVGVTKAERKLVWEDNFDEDNLIDKWDIAESCGGNDGTLIT